MPPTGSNLSDDGIASVLTYVRHEWGHAAEPVDPGAVKAVRAQSAGRTRPWTVVELTRILGPRERSPSLSVLCRPALTRVRS